VRLTCPPPPPPRCPKPSHPQPTRPPAPLTRTAPRAAPRAQELNSQRTEVLTGEQERELALMVKDCLELERLRKELLESLGREPTHMEFMAAEGTTRDVRWGDGWVGGRWGGRG